MKIILAKSAGFCFGVNRAVDAVYDCIKKYKLPIFTYGPIIHNKKVVNDLLNKGVSVLENIDDIKNINEGIVIIRSHGVSPYVYEVIDNKKLLSMDMTCPYVKKIHKIVKQYFDEGYQIIIIGDENHPEVQGINGWCENNAVIVESIDDCKKINDTKKMCIVAQTTFNEKKFYEIKNHITTDKNKEAVIFNTICSATSQRQKEAQKVAKNADAMIIIGDKKSSNTQKLYNICSSYCDNCYYIEGADEINMNQIKEFEIVGITAGASAPKDVIDEVVNLLSSNENTQIVINSSKDEENLKVEKMDDLTDEIEKSLINLEEGDLISGEIIGINDEEIIIDFGYKTEGIIPVEELSSDYINNIKIGNKIEAIVIKISQDKNVVLSKKVIDIDKAWEKIKNAYDSKENLLVKVVNQVKGGMIANFEGLEVFIPLSQLSNKFISDPQEFISDIIPVKIIEVDENKNRAVASSKIVMEENSEKEKNNFWDALYVGKSFTGKVKNLANYGAFIDLGGVDGLLHISEVPWTGSEYTQKMNIDDEIEVYVKEFDKEHEKISLGLKNKPQGAWDKVEQKYSSGDIVEATVVKFAPFGAFLEIESGILGLVHISQISDKRLLKPDEVLEIGLKVKAKINNINVKEKKMSLSIKDVYPINEKGETNIDFKYNVQLINDDFGVTIKDLINIKKNKK